MDEILIGKTLIKYQITFKKNKNTYFYFKKPGYIQINASKYQSKKEILKYIKSNSVEFINKYEKLKSSKPIDNTYRIWGKEYHVLKDTFLKYLQFDHESYKIVEPTNMLDGLNEVYKKEEKKILLKEALFLKNKYMKNALIDISKIKIKTRSTSSRFGSCNYRLNTINLNLELVHYDKKFIEYVFLHEIAHLVYQNHSIDFYNLLDKICPNHRELKKELNQKFKR